MKTTNWMLRLIDQMSGPAKGMTRELMRVQRTLAAIERTSGTGGQTTMFGRMRQGLRGMGLSGVTVDLGSLAGGFLNAGRAALDMGMSLGRSAIDLASFREGSLVALETTLGSSEAAARSFTNALNIANQTPLDTRDVVAMTQRFAVGGFGEREIAPLLAASSDLASAFGQQSADSFALVTSQMRAAGRMDRGDLRQLLNSGVNTGAVLDSIARQLNIQGRDETTRRNAVLAAITQRRVGGDVGVQAALDAIQGRLDGGQALGTFALRQSQTLVGAISNARNAIDNLFLSFSLSSTPGLLAVKNTILAVTKALSPATTQGQRLIRVFTGISNGVFGAIFGGDAKGVGGVIDQILGALEQVAPVIVSVTQGVMTFVRAMGPGFMAAVGPAMDLLVQLRGEGGGTSTTMRDIGRAVGWLAGAFVLGVGVILGVGGALLFGWNQIVTVLPATLSLLWDSITQWFSGIGPALYNIFYAVPRQMVDGFVLSLRTEWGRITTELTTLASALPEPVRRALGIRSPSRVFMELGAYTAEGFALGIGSGAGDVDGALAGLVVPPAAQALSGGFGGASVSLTVVIEGGNQNAQEIATATVDQFEERLASIFGRLAETG